LWLEERGQHVASIPSEEGGGPFGRGLEWGGPVSLEVLCWSRLREHSEDRAKDSKEEKSDSRELESSWKCR